MWGLSTRLIYRLIMVRIVKSDLVRQMEPFGIAVLAPFT